MIDLLVRGALEAEAGCVGKENEVDGCFEVGEDAKEQRFLLRWRDNKRFMVQYVVERYGGYEVGRKYRLRKGGGRSEVGELGCVYEYMKRGQMPRPRVTDGCQDLGIKKGRARGGGGCNA